MPILLSTITYSLIYSVTVPVFCTTAISCFMVFHGFILWCILIFHLLEKTALVSHSCFILGLEKLQCKQEVMHGYSWTGWWGRCKGFGSSQHTLGLLMPVDVRTHSGIQTKWKGNRDLFRIVGNSFYSLALSSNCWSCCLLSTWWYCLQQYINQP